LKKDAEVEKRFEMLETSVKAAVSMIFRRNL
jgi:hypothetical protein